MRSAGLSSIPTPREDVRIVPEAARATRMYGWPLFVEGADGSPVTMVAEIPEAG